MTNKDLLFIKNSIYNCDNNYFNQLGINCAENIIFDFNILDANVYSTYQDIPNNHVNGQFVFEVVYRLVKDVVLSVNHLIDKNLANDVRCLVILSASLILPCITPLNYTDVEQVPIIINNKDSDSIKLLEVDLNSLQGSDSLDESSSSSSSMPIYTEGNIENAIIIPKK